MSYIREKTISKKTAFSFTQSEIEIFVVKNKLDLLLAIEHR